MPGILNSFMYGGHVNLLGYFFSAEGVGATTCTMTFRSDGVLSGNAGGPFDIVELDGEWWSLSPVSTSGVGADYEIRVTETSGNVSTGTTGTWLSLGTSRSWTRSVSGTGEQEVVMTVEIRRASDSVLLDSAEYTLNASGGG
jgi:hypothetical protein